MAFGKLLITLLDGFWIDFCREVLVVLYIHFFVNIVVISFIIRPGSVEVDSDLTFTNQTSMPNTTDALVSLHEALNTSNLLNISLSSIEICKSGSFTLLTCILLKSIKDQILEM